MEDMNILCKNCGHSFKWHQQATYELWFCDFANTCECNEFIKTVGKGTEDDPIEVLYDSESYKWN